MNTGLKIGLIIGGVAAVGVAAYFIVKAVKKNKDGGTDDVGETETDVQTETETETETESPYTETPVQPGLQNVTKEWFVSYVDETKNLLPTSKNPNLSVHFANPRPNFSEITIGNTINLINMGKYSGRYEVKGTWKDTNGKLGAIHLLTILVDKSAKNNRTWENTGKVALMA